MSANESETVRITLVPLGKTLSVKRGEPLQQQLFAHGVEFPCGGRGRCRRCRVRVLKGHLSVTPTDAQRLSQADIDAGWRLACQARAETDLTLELAQWEASILGDDMRFEFTPKEGLGVAIDLGTTTIVAQLLDLQTGNVLGVRSALNSQAQYGSDIMSRVEYAISPGGLDILTQTVRQQTGRLVTDLLRELEARATGSESTPASEALRTVIIVGNTVMHHLFCGISVEPLSHHPFEPCNDGLQRFSASDLGWDVPGRAEVMFLPCLGGFIGSDILAGILATGIHTSDRLVALVDLGTNGEIVMGNRTQLLCASTAAGPAFEGARISMGMLAATGAISAVKNDGGRFQCTVLGDGRPRGICGSGLVDAIAVALDLGLIDHTGRLKSGDSLVLEGQVTINQKDIRELQLAKGAIAAGIRLLLERWNAQSEDLDCLWLAGAFGNYISRASAKRIGLIPFPTEKVKPAGNTALRGAKHVLLGAVENDPEHTMIRQRVLHVPLNEEPRFHEVFVSEMQFPAPDCHMPQRGAATAE